MQSSESFARLIYSRCSYYQQKIMLHVNSYYNKEMFHAFHEYSTILNIQRRKTEHYSSLASCPKHTSIFATLIPLQSVILIYDITEMKKLFSRAWTFCYIRSLSSYQLHNICRLFNLRYRSIPDFENSIFWRRISNTNMFNLINILHLERI